MNIQGRYYPFDGGNINSQYRPMVTPSYFNASSILPVNSSGQPVRSPSGNSTTWPIGIEPYLIFDLWANVKTMSYAISIEFEEEQEDITMYTNMESLSTHGLLRRCLVSNGSIFKYAFKSFRTAGNGIGSSTSDDVIIDFTKCFYDSRKTGLGATDLKWFPYIKFDIVGQSGVVTVGEQGDPLLSFFGILLPGIPITVISLGSGVPVNTVPHDLSIKVLERYCDIAVTPTIATAGSTELTITLPAFNKSYDTSDWRDGLGKVTEITFGGNKTTTEFQKIPNDKGVVDTLKVIPPAGSKSGNIQFKSTFNPAKPAETTDYFTAPQYLNVRG